jgi:hypothetical protein
MTVVTPGWSMIHRKANCAIVIPRDTTGASSRTAVANLVRHTGERLTNVERLTVLVERPVVVGRERGRLVMLPGQQARRQGNRAMMPTPASRAAGSTSPSGRRRKQLRMICMLAGRAG